MEWRVDRNDGIPNLWQGSSRENRLSWPTEAAGKGGAWEKGMEEGDVRPLTLR